MTQPPALSAILWRQSIPTFAEAWTVQQALRPHYQTALGINSRGFFVASPDSGLSEKLHTCEKPPLLTPMAPEMMAELFDMAA